jgi:hypothetical protein
MTYESASSARLWLGTAGGTVVLRVARRHQRAAWLALRGAPGARDQLAARF